MQIQMVDVRAKVAQGLEKRDLVCRVGCEMERMGSGMQLGGSVADKSFKRQVLRARIPTCMEE